MTIQHTGDDTGGVVPAEAAQHRDGQILPARDELTARAESYARGARADKTWAAYERQWARFETWCADAGSGHCPPTR